MKQPTPLTKTTSMGAEIVVVRHAAEGHNSTRAGLLNNTAGVPQNN
jgi:hypothetical protein